MEDLIKFIVNIYIIGYVGKIFVLEEGYWFYELLLEFDMVGVYNYDGKLKIGMMVYLKVCGEIGELFFFVYGLMVFYFIYYWVFVDGELF